MKMKFATALLTLAASFGFAQEVIPAIPVGTKVVNRDNSFTYFNLRMADEEVNKTPSFLPGVGAGYRYSINNASSVDISGNYSGQFDTEKPYYYTVPKASYLRYASPDRDSSFYYGAGLAWGGMKRPAVYDATKKEAILKEAVDFQGIVPSVSIGGEMGRSTNGVKSFVQLDVSQPTLRIGKEVSFKNLPRPIAEVSFGLGF